MAERVERRRPITKFAGSSGSALLWALLVLMVFSILGSSLFFMMATEVRQSLRHDFWTQAYLYAYSGIEVARAIFEDDQARYPNSYLLSSAAGFYLYGCLDDLVLEVGPFVEASHGMDPEERPSVIASVYSEGNVWYIESTGWYRGTERTLRVNL